MIRPILALILCIAAPAAAQAPVVVYNLLKLASAGDGVDLVRVGEGGDAFVAALGGFNSGFAPRGDGALEARGAESELLLTLEPRAYRLTVELTGESVRAVSAFLNGHLLGRGAAGEGRRALSFAVPAEHVALGDNFLTFSWKGARRARGRLSRRRRLLQKPTPEPLRAIVHRVELRPASAPAERGVSVYVQVPQGATLEGRVAGTGEARVRVAPAAEGKGELLAIKAESEAPALASLAPWAGQIVRLTLATTGDAVWKEARLLAPAPAAATTAAPGPPKNVILWVVDTLRADRLACIQPETRVRTPNFDGFARKGAVFVKAIAQSSHSKPASASILTGHYPASHGASDHKDKLREDVPLLSELFAAAGHVTAAFASNGFIGKPHGFVRGWKSFRNLLREGRPSKIPFLFPHVERWLRAHKGERFFLYVHSVDPHVPYNPPRHVLSLYYPGRYRGPLVPRQSGYQLDDARAGKFHVGPGDRVFAEALYDGEVTVADTYFGKLLDLLESLGLAKETLVAVTADHGEEFWEHGNPGHGHTLYNELTRVPLLLGPAPFVPAGKVVKTDVEMVDLAPTVLDLAGVPVPAEVQGRSLRATLEADLPVSPPAFALHEGRIASAQAGRWKYVVYRGGAERVFDLVADAREQRDLAGAQPIVRRYLRGLLAEWLAKQGKWRKARDGIIGQPK